MTQWRQLVKKHGFLMAGVGLPALVVLLFLLARLLPQWLVAPPQFDVLYVVQDGYSGAQEWVGSQVSVVDGRLQVKWTRYDEPTYHAQPRVVRLRVGTDVAETVSLPGPDDLQSLRGTESVFVDTLGPVRVDPSSRSPDGYEFEVDARHGSGLMNEVFFDRHRGPRPVLRKNGRIIKVPRMDGSSYGYGSVRFLGWLVPVEDVR